MAAPTRTLNPLPIGDLEPHRFEDLVRQLAYDFREWKSLEAVGRSGSDEGIDIRAVESYAVAQDVTDDEDGWKPSMEERLWIFQCKREKNLGPAKIRTSVSDSIRSTATPTHGFILAAACDISKKGRDAFRAEMVSRGVQEFLVWAKGE